MYVMVSLVYGFLAKLVPSFKRNNYKFVFLFALHIYRMCYKVSLKKEAVNRNLKYTSLMLRQLYFKTAV